MHVSGHRKKELALFFLLLCLPATSQEDADRAVAVTKAIAKRIGECPRREVIGQFKKEWEKQAWGPPTDLKVDVRKSASQSILYPYEGIIEFSLVWSYGPRRKTKQDAAADLELESGLLPKARYRNTYKLNKGEFVLDSREVLSMSGQWASRPEWPDACWDHITSVETH